MIIRRGISDHPRQFSNVVSGMEKIKLGFSFWPNNHESRRLTCRYNIKLFHYMNLLASDSKPLMPLPPLLPPPWLFMYICSAISAAF